MFVVVKFVLIFYFCVVVSLCLFYYSFVFLLVVVCICKYFFLKNGVLSPILCIKNVKNRRNLRFFSVFYRFFIAKLAYFCDFLFCFAFFCAF